MSHWAGELSRLQISCAKKAEAHLSPDQMLPHAVLALHYRLDAADVVCQT